MLPCVTEGSVVVKITITLIKGYTGEEMLMFLKEWTDTVPTIKMDGLVLSIESVCNSSDCLSVTPSMIDTTKERASSTLVSAVTVPIVVIIMIVLIVIGIIIVTLMIKKSRCVNIKIKINYFFKLSALFFAVGIQGNTVSMRVN